MKEYLQSLIWITVVVCVLTQMLPGEKYQKLFGMAAGWVILLVLTGPLLHLFGMDASWQQAFKEAVVAEFPNAQAPLDTYEAGRNGSGVRAKQNMSATLLSLQKELLEDQMSWYVLQYFSLSDERDVEVEIDLDNCDTSGKINDSNKLDVRRVKIKLPLELGAEKENFVQCFSQAFGLEEKEIFIS